MLLVSSLWERQGQLNTHLLRVANRLITTDPNRPQFIAAHQKEGGRQFGVVEVFCDEPKRNEQELRVL